MQQTTILDRVRAVFAEFYGPSKLLQVGNDSEIWAEVPPRAAFPPRLMDAIDHLEFVMALEEEFHVTLPDEMVEKCTTLTATAAQIEAILARNLAKTA
jgi:acyl carrier protein